MKAVLLIIFTTHNALPPSLCAFQFSLHPRKGSRSVILLTAVKKHTKTWIPVGGGGKVRCCCDLLCTEGEGEPRWRGYDEELTGLSDCSMSLRSHIFRRRSLSFSSCSLVLKSLSSFLSLSSVASISHLDNDGTKSTIRQISQHYWGRIHELL